MADTLYYVERLSAMPPLSDSRTADVAVHTPWMDPVRYDGRMYVAYGNPVRLSAHPPERIAADNPGFVEAIARYQGVPLYAEAGLGKNRPEVLYVPIVAKDCLIMAYVSHT